MKRLLKVSQVYQKNRSSWLFWWRSTEYDFKKYFSTIIFYSVLIRRELFYRRIAGLRVSTHIVK